MAKRGLLYANFMAMVVISAVSCENGEAKKNGSVLKTRAVRPVPEANQPK
ncbi:hypothetical protein B0I21_101295 [Sphingobacterium paludis]|uniref:Uncharacterized protein n=1 Tax=Sphingobacterium paludis TaxID=1476465 RepID=A0A4R7D8T7_9SPHI|nr:hypothetical protein B0I21_101295 [Sphingobacterium paludis]